jgi:hypothetical protein
MDLSIEGMSYCPAPFEIVLSWSILLPSVVFLYAVIATLVNYLLVRIGRKKRQIEPFKVTLYLSRCFVLSSTVISFYSVYHAVKLSHDYLEEYSSAGASAPSSIGYAWCTYSSLSHVMVLVTLSMVASSLLLLLVTLVNEKIGRQETPVSTGT